MLKIGCHLSCAKGYLAMAETALSINANTFQFFTRNPRGGKAKNISQKDLNDFLIFCKEYEISQVLAHAPYTLNPCAKDEGLREFARNIMSDDLRIMDMIPGGMYNFHPGSHVQQGVETGIHLIIEHLNAIITPEIKTEVLLETMSGKGSEIGRNFQEIRNIIDGVRFNEKLGVCLDTCHLWEGGYDIVNHLDDVLDEFDNVIGLHRLKAIHLNDSKNPMSAHKDRHECIGFGQIGLEALVAVINNPRLKKLPFYLETPQEDLNGYAKEISMLRNFYVE
jgi:deoxyribonuclease-4